MIKAILSYKQLDPFMLTPFDAESELFVREREYREERQFCEPEGGNRATMSVQTGSVTPGNAAGGPSTRLVWCFTAHS